jgi:hypothetical protein
MKYYLFGIIERLERFLIPSYKPGVRDAYKVQYLILIGADAFLFKDWWANIVSKDTLESIGIFFIGLLAQFFLFIGIQLICGIGYVILEIAIGYFLLNKEPENRNSKHWRKSLPGYPVFSEEEQVNYGCESWQNSIAGFAVALALFHYWEHIVLIVITWGCILCMLKVYQYIKNKINETEDF